MSVGHVCLLAPLSADVAPEELFHQIHARLHLAPILRRRLQAPTFVVGRPWWIDDPDFDLDRHLTSVDLGGTAGEQDMLAAAIRYAAVHLDRDRPLWGLHLIRGLADGSSALVTKMHHCMIDGVGKRDLMALLFATDDPAEPTGDWEADAGPGDLARVAHRVTEAGSRVTSLLRLEARALGAAPAALLRATRDTATRLADTLEQFVEHPVPHTPTAADPRKVGTAPPTPFNAAITGARAWAFTDLLIADSKAARTATGATVNDVLVAATAGALRAWLLERDALPDDPLVVMVPMAVRGAVQAGRSNSFTLALCPIPTHLGDPWERLEFAHVAMAHAKDSPTYPTSLLDDVASLSGPTVAHLFTQAASWLHLADVVSLPFNTMISNVPAPAARFHLGRGAEVLGMYPFPPLSDGIGLMLTAHGYAGRLGVGIGTCPDLVPDPQHVRELLIAAHEQICALDR